MLSVLAAAGLLAISLLHYLHEPMHIQGLDYLKYVALGAIALEGPLVGLKAFLSLRRKVKRFLPPGPWTCHLPFESRGWLDEGTATI